MVACVAPGSPTTTFAPLSWIWYPASAGVSAGLTGVTQAPRCQAAKSATTSSTPVGQDDGDHVVRANALRGQCDRRGEYGVEECGVADGPWPSGEGADTRHDGSRVSVHRDGREHDAGFSWRFSTVPEVRASHDTPAAVGLVGRG